MGTRENAETKQHIRRLLEDVREQETPDVRDEAVQFLTEFADVLASSDLDLGKCDALNQQIDIGYERPVKQRMRRNPTVSQGKEEGHLDKMSLIGKSRSNLMIAKKTSFVTKYVLFEWGSICETPPQR